MLHSLISLFHLYNFQPYLKLYSKLALIDVYLGIFLCFLLAWYKFSLFAISMTRLGSNFSKSHFYHVSRDKKNYHTHHTLPSQPSSPILCVSRMLNRIVLNLCPWHKHTHHAAIYIDSLFAFGYKQYRP